MRSKSQVVAIFIMILSSSLAKGQVSPIVDCDLIKKTKFKEARIEVCGKPLNVEVADTDWLRTIGLMCREHLLPESGMIFVFPDERDLSFWMKNTPLPLSIGYFDKNKTLINTYDMKPLDETKLYKSKSKSLYAVETNQGWFSKNKIKPGCKFKFQKK